MKSLKVMKDIFVKFYVNKVKKNCLESKWSISNNMPLVKHCLLVIELNELKYYPLYIFLSHLTLNLLIFI